MAFILLTCSIALATGSLSVTAHALSSSQFGSKTSNAKAVPIQMHTRPNGAFIIKRQQEQPVMRTHAHVKIDGGATVSMLQNNEPVVVARGHDSPSADALKAVAPPRAWGSETAPDGRAMGDFHYKYTLGALVILAIVLVWHLFQILAPRLPSAYLAYVVCAVYVALSVSIDLLIASLRQQEEGKKFGTYAFDPACCVILVEACKLVFSLLLLAGNYYSGTVDLSDFHMKDFLKREAGWLSLPGILFTANNFLLFMAIGKNDMAAFGVFRETLILWTSLFWRCFFKVELGIKRTIGIGIIFLGMAGNRVGATEWSWAILWILAMTFSNASATVVNEFALKRTMGLDINVQNATLYVVCMTCSVLVLAVRSPSKLLSFSAFFEGFAPSTVLTVTLQILAGLTVSRILKYADSVTKCVAATLRGPILVLLAPYLVHSSSELSAILSSVVVSAGCLMYLLQGPIQTGLQKAPVPIAIPRPEKMAGNEDACVVKSPATN